MSNRQLVLVECLLRFGNELNQAQSSADVRWRSANSCGDGLDGVGVGFELNQRGVALRRSGVNRNCLSFFAACTELGPVDARLIAVARHGFAFARQLQVASNLARWYTCVRKCTEVSYGSGEGGDSGVSGKAS